MYYNTTNESGATLRHNVNKAETQNKAITRLFFKEPVLSPFEVYVMLNKENWPLTSIRRALNTLTKDRKLIKLPTKIIGKYGRPEHQWCNADYYNGREK